MIGCHTIRPEIPIPLSEFSKTPDPRLPALWCQSSFAPVGQSQALIEIERFVDSVLSSNAPAYRVRPSKDGKNSVRITSLGERLLEVLPLLGLFDSYHDYAEKPYAFLRACWATEVWLKVDLAMIGANPAWAATCFFEQLNILIESVREMGKSGWFKRCVSDRKYESNRRASEINKYVANILFERSKTLVVRVDLFYREEARLRLTIDELYADLGRFLSRLSSHRYFAHLRGYFWVVEEGSRKKGPHIHFGFLFDGSKVREDVTLGDMICGLWDVDVTHGKGDSWNCNRSKDRYKELGIGMIERSNWDACRNAVYFATYPAKDPHRPGDHEPQYVRIKPAGARIFGTGCRKFLKSRVGRPPVNPVIWLPVEFRDLRWPEIPES